MPNYDFRCLNCDHKFSKLVPMAEKDQVTCPVCGSKTKQLFTWGGAVKSGGGSSGSRSCELGDCGGRSGFG